MSNMLQTLAVFVCLGISLSSCASKKEDLERAAELVVERVAERAAERAVEKALESGNSTTESKIVRESYSSRRKDPPPKIPKYRPFETEKDVDYSAGRREISEETLKEAYEDPDEGDWSKVESGNRNRKWARLLTTAWPKIDFRCSDESHEHAESINYKHTVPYIQERLGRVQKRLKYWRDDKK